MKMIYLDPREIDNMEVYPEVDDNYWRCKWADLDYEKDMRLRREKIEFIDSFRKKFD